MDLSQGWKSDTRFLVLVNHIDNDVSWVSRLKFPYIIYTKGDSATYKGKAESNLLKFISDYYDKLPENLIVVHDRERSCYHEGSLVDLLNDDTFEHRYRMSKMVGFWNWNTQKLGPISSLSGKMMQSGWWKKCMEPWLGPLDKCQNFTQGKNGYSQFVVSRDRIHSLSQKFYLNMYNWICESCLDEEAPQVDPITGFKNYPKNWNHPNSSYYVSLYLSSSWEFIFTAWKSTDNISVTLPDGRKMFAVYGADGYYHDVTGALLTRCFRDGSIVISHGENFNEIFGDNLYGVVKSLRVTIDGVTTSITEQRTVVL